MNEFLKLFGDITVSDIVIFATACAFLAKIYIKWKKYLVSKYEIEKSKDNQMKKILEAVSDFAEYKEQSVKVQEITNNEIQEIKAIQQDNAARIDRIEEENRQRECNRLRDIILQNYRYYINKETNPSQSWTQMEHDNFFALIGDYETLHGNGFVHTVVIPAMESLRIVEME